MKTIIKLVTLTWLVFQAGHEKWKIFQNHSIKFWYDEIDCGTPFDENSYLKWEILHAQKCTSYSRVLK